MGVPRAVFILIGGALVDRYSPKRVLMLTKYANAALLGLLAVLVLTHQISLPILYALALALGLLGMGLSSLKADLRIGTLGTTLLVADGVAGVLLMFMGYVHAAWQGAALMLALGALSGFMQVAVFTWIQRRVPREMLGRTMSIFMFILMGLAPPAASLTGLVMQHLTLAQLFTGAGLFLVAGVLLAFALTPMRVMNDPKSATIPDPPPST